MRYYIIHPLKHNLSLDQLGVFYFESVRKGWLQAIPITMAGKQFQRSGYDDKLPYSNELPNRVAILEANLKKIDQEVPELIIKVDKLLDARSKADGLENRVQEIETNSKAIIREELEAKLKADGLVNKVQKLEARLQNTHQEPTAKWKICSFQVVIMCVTLLVAISSIFVSNFLPIKHRIHDVKSLNDLGHLAWNGPLDSQTQTIVIDSLMNELKILNETFIIKNQLLTWKLKMSHTKLSIASINDGKYPKQGNVVTVNLNLLDEHGMPFNFPLDSLSCKVVGPDGAAVKCNIEQPQDGKYLLAFTPQNHGKHTYGLQAPPDIAIPDGPFEIYIVPSPENRGTPVLVITGELEEPKDVAVDSAGNIFVADSTGYIFKFDSAGNVATVINIGNDSAVAEGPLVHPKSVAVAPDDSIIVADENRLIKFSPDGKLVTVINSSNSGISSPHGIAVHPKNGLIYVVDESDCSIHILDDNFNRLYQPFGSKGNKRGQFFKPIDVAIDNNGYIFVVDKNHRAILIFTSEGNPETQFGNYHIGTTDHQPMYCAIDVHDLLYIVEKEKNRIAIVDMNKLKYEYQATVFGDTNINGTEFVQPSGIAIDKKGKLYVADTGNKRVVVY